jgi:DNA-binding MarR family transcriptional regulator
MKKVKLETIAPREQALAAADRLHSAAIHLLRQLRRQDSATGEGPARLSALSVLVFAGSKTLGELADAEQVKPPTMSRIVAGLESSGLVKISREAADARRMNICASRKGERLLREGRRRRIEYLAERLQTLKSEDLAQLSDAAETIERVLRQPMTEDKRGG